MVSNRQKVARRRFREEHDGGGGGETPLLLRPTAGDGGTKKKKRKNEKKGEGRDSAKDGRPAKFMKQSNGLKKHPLRVPGMKPGESCFICKGKDHVAKNCPTKATWDKNKICLLCRHRGHSLKNCPKFYGDKEKKCYNCGGIGHSLSKCPMPLQDGGTKFAECFICKMEGHLSKNCPDNKHGIYPKGGCCKVCGGLTHLAKDCPSKHNKSTIIHSGTDQTSNGFANFTQARKIIFSSGDDLEDDFTVEEPQQKEPNPKEIPSSSSVGDHANAKKKQGPKVVLFTR
ncbi:Uncharacterized protein EJ110_NYTH36471 [Nymphaea thermarum]|nr:Uncharacterized protein EJ110_NYTH36471 [Nymphaea thermarum]